MIEIGMKIAKPVMDWNLYGDAADWCNQNGAKIEEREVM